MKTMKKCLLFVGLIGIMGAIKTDYVVVNQNITTEDQKEIANEVMSKIEQKEREKSQERIKIAVGVFAAIGFLGSMLFVEFAILDTFFFFKKLGENAATCASNCAKNAANPTAK